MHSHLDPRKLKAGILDAYAEEAFRRGACAAIALAIHERTHWPIVAITDHHNVFEDGRAGGGSALHWTVKAPDGRLLDVDGLHTAEELIEEYEEDADEGEAAAGLSTVADITEWYIEAQGEPIPLELARTFVDAVLKKAGLT